MINNSFIRVIMQIHSEVIEQLVQRIIEEVHPLRI
jgi:signal-transduction protein with cAMP-binding, CBS, and nucleotidyltransferase domain